MKKSLTLATLILATSLYADLEEIKAKLLQEFINILLPNQEVKINIHDSNFESVKDMESGFTFEQDCEKVNFIITKNYKNLSPKCKLDDKVILVTSYPAYLHDSKAVGAVFWQKGRLNIIFRKKRLDDFSIKLPEKYSKYIEE